MSSQAGTPVQIDGVDYLVAEDAASMLGVKPATLYAYASRGVIRSWRQGIKRRRLYKLADLATMLDLEPASGRLPLAEDWIPFSG